ncbi:MAG: DeoR/GlpR family DNA-binding transcription regulator, partial [Eubacteriaceae bacterium]
MLAKERQDQIASKVNSDGSVLVKDLAEQYGVTEDSIRKDLSILEKGGLLQKTYGGAVKIRERGHDFYVAQRRNKNPAAKRSIAEKAYALIENGDTVFLDISTSNIELAKLLIEREKPV